jgi:hypothetical protein
MLFIYSNFGKKHKIGNFNALYALLFRLYSNTGEETIQARVAACTLKEKSQTPT